jgi:hypothetical protein
MMRGRGEPSHILSSTRNGESHGRRTKRYHDEDEEELCIDDLAVAAQYAFAVPTSATPVALVVPRHSMNNNNVDFVVVDEDEIDLDEEEEASLQSQSPVEATGAGVSSVVEENNIPPATEKPNILGPGYDSTDDDSDEESDMDILERLAHMEGGGDDEDSDDGDAPDRSAGAVPRKLMTVNEIDAYQADLHQLQDLLQWNTIAPPSANICSGPPELQIAGHVQHHVIEERTIVILSLQGGDLLKEGTPLVLRQSSSASSTVAKQVIPLGNILEIFGPVSQPLYSVRLAMPREETVGSKEHESSGMEHAEAEIAAGGKALPTLPILDPWTKGGKYTKVLQANAKQPVYFWHDSSAIMDREAVYRNSSRGCDASNIFDEEILEVQDYSDDEQERVSKGHRKKGGNGGIPGTMINSRRHDRQRPSSRGAPDPGHHSQSGSSSAAYAVRQPHGFHSQGQTPSMYRQGVQVPYTLPQQIAGNPMYNPPQDVHNSPQVIPPPGLYVQPPPFFYYNGVYQTIPPPPAQESSAATPSNSQVGSTGAVYYDFS